MTEKRFIEFHKDCRVIKNTQTGETATYYDTEDGLMFLKWLNNLSDENKELKQRNNRQAKQLDRLYHLIEEKDWRTLSDILDDFKRCEEQLQREWKCYE